MFDRAIVSPHAARDTSDQEDEIARRQFLSIALRSAGWSADHVQRTIAGLDSIRDVVYPTSVGVAKGLEAQLERVSAPIKTALKRLGFVNHDAIVLGIEPIVGPSASLTNVIMTDEGIVSVSSFLFRWCGLCARAYTRTLLLDPIYWSEAPPSLENDARLLRMNPDLCLYWVRILNSFGVTGTHAFVPFRPASPNEALLFEQIAWSMEYFAVAHEFAHHALCHRSLGDDSLTQEFEADMLAARICELLEFEPFDELHNPYNTTGAGGVLMISSLDLLRDVESAIGAQRVDLGTHPSTEERIGRIALRHSLQPNRLRMDQNFCNTVVRIMRAIKMMWMELIDANGKDQLATMKREILNQVSHQPPTTPATAPSTFPPLRE